MSRLTPDNQQRLMVASVSTLTNLMLKRGFRNAFMHGVAPLWSAAGNMAGPAFTLRFIPAREDIDTMAGYAGDRNVHRRAIEECPRGHVLVIDAGGTSRGASAGDMMIARLTARVAAGIVTDGGYRDVAGIEAIGLPAFQRQNAAPATPIALHAADLNQPVGCGGVVVIPASLANEIAGETADVSADEEFVSEKIAAGRSIFGLFPATPESRIEYDAWRAQRDKS